MILRPIPPVGIDLSRPELIVPKRTGTAETYDELKAISPIKSTVPATGIFIWTFLDLNPTLRRKEAIGLLVKSGVNINTARTQYQLWRTARGLNRKKK